MNGVNLETGKKPLRKRSPFIDVPMINCAGIAEADKFFDDLEARSSPRLIKTHYPFELLPPNLLDTCKVTRLNGDGTVHDFHFEGLFRCFLSVVMSRMLWSLTSTMSPS